MAVGIMAELVETCPVVGATFSDSFGAPRSGGRHHQGQDLMAAVGTPIHAAHGGRAVEADNALGGIAVQVIRGAGHTYYAHMQRRAGRFGREVRAGEIIGYVDNTGDAAHTASHCHFEVHPIVRPPGLPVSPYGYSWIDGAANSIRELRRVCGQATREFVTVSIPEFLALAYYVGFRGSRMVTAVAVGEAESEGFEGARHVDAPGSVDRGLWQINSHAHPDVSDRCAFNGLCNARQAFQISRQGSNWHPWSTYNSGAYREHLTAVLHRWREGSWRAAVPHIPRLFRGDPGTGGGGPGPIDLGHPGRAVMGERYAPLVHHVSHIAGELGRSALSRDRDLGEIIRSWRRWF